MSHSAEYEWRQRQEDRRRQHLSRIRAVTAEFVTRYESVLDDLRRQGLDTATPAEFASLSRQVSELRQLLLSDPERARALSLALGNEVHALPRLARQARQHADAQAARRCQELGSELVSVLEQTFRSIADPVVRDFAYVAAAGIEAEIKARVAQGAQLESFHAKLTSRMTQIVAQAEADSVQWKRVQLSAQKDAVRADVVADVTAVAGAQTRLQTAIDQILSYDDAGFDAAVEAALADADRAVVDEESRRAAVRAVYESLMQAGFAVDQPYLEEGCGGSVVVSARKPSGGHAQFRIGAEGGLVYKFDHYEGAACKQDLQQVLPMLHDIYGITLSSERVLWDNPDRLSRDARPLDDQEAQR
ncbi:hypothetical protein [Janthinobacterium sp. 78]|uniref:hypothetical protein n=1 Tax=Janthinobacterium sp. 78 TaxID=2135631 RepID=UPI000D5F437D|nr:hypothetical protein [Janthinobacterium sp. 78]PVX38188.1 hypothetical protein C8C92_4857 [Janthinobacterium sp. 78]